MVKKNGHRGLLMLTPKLTKPLHETANPFGLKIVNFQNENEM